jgi:hypothetical protein
MVPRSRKSGIHIALRNLEKPGFRFFCAGCGRERKLAPPAKAGSLRFFAHVVIATGFFSLLSWPWMGFKGLLAWVIPVGFVMEALHRLKMRSALECPDCRFDPFLYLSDQKRAVSQVEDAWRKKFKEKGIPFPENPRASRISRRPLDLREGSGVIQRHVNQ